MDPHKLAVTLAIAAGWLSFNSLIIAMYLMLRGRGVLKGSMWRSGEWLRHGRRAAPLTVQHEFPLASAAFDQKQTSSGRPEQNASLEAVAPESDDMEINDLSAAHVLFVLFEKPDMAINKRLQLSLQTWDAHYDTVQQVYSVPGVTPQNPWRVTNAYPPGVMPANESFQQEENLLGGVSVILKKPKRKRGFDKVQLEKLITFTQELAAIGGTVLDAQRQGATPATFQAIRHK
jgi:hypothetical protein